ncbi:MAG TPA: hypothetical protein VN822_10220 [Candidatus Acidoferrales bacterium]|nr:hypothetical protein [Candidatus Acidoferrales bacterium]
MPRRMDVQQAAEDLRRRTLSEIPRSLDRLIYLASMRDYNTGLYYHDGLASRFTQEVACEALADCHREAFRDLVGSPLRGLVCQMEGYMDSTHTSPGEFLTAWKKLEPYRVAVPVETDPLSAEFLFSSFKIALAILEARLRPAPAAPDA